MKLNHPIKINFKDFLLEGKFDHINFSKKPTKEWMSNNFPNPDSENDIGNKFDIWLYGNIEFHFENQNLFLIWCDSLSDIKNDEKIVFDKWILNDTSKLTLLYVVSVLNREQSNYMVKFNKTSKNAIIKIKKSDVCLFFDSLHDDEEQPNDYQMIGFGLNHPDYERFYNGF